MWIRYVLVALAVMLGAVTVQAYQDERIKVTLIGEHTTLQPGATTWLGVRFEPIEHWHVYWQNPGDSGLAPKISLTLPEGVTAGDIHWPAPERIPVAHMVNYGYHHTLLMIPLMVDRSVHVDQSLNIQAKVSWLVCREECVPGRARLQLTLPVSDKPLTAGKHADAFRQIRDQVPQPLPTPAHYRVAGKTVKLHIDVPAGATGEATIFPVTPDLVPNSEQPKISRKGDRITASFPLSEYATDTRQPFEFVVVLEGGAIYQGRAAAMN